jgi:hypothetical protein
VTDQKITYVIMCFYCEKQKPGFHHYRISNVILAYSKIEPFECYMCKECFELLINIHIDQNGGPVKDCNYCGKPFEIKHNYVCLSELKDNWFLRGQVNYHVKCFKSLCTTKFYKKLI